MYHQEIKQKAVKLRKEGYSYNYIVQHVPVTKSTLSEWLRDVPFNPNKHTIETIGNARIASGKYKHQIKMDSLERAKLQAEKEIISLSDREIMMLGLGIYIREGGKTAGITRIINSDPNVIKVVLRWFKVIFGIKVSNLKVRLHLYPDNNQAEAIKFWSKALSVDKKYFSKPTIDTRTNRKISNAGKLPFGTAHVTVKSFGDKELGVYLHRYILALIDRVFMLH